MSYLARVISGTDDPSSHRFVAVCSTITLCASILIATIAAALGVKELTTIIAGLGGSLAMVMGYVYKVGTASEKTDGPA